MIFELPSVYTREKTSPSLQFSIPEQGEETWLVFVSPERMFVETHSDPNSVCPFVRASVRPLKFWLTFFKLLLFEQVRFNYNQSWYIGALWEPSHYDALRGHMTRSKVIGGQIVIVISVNLFQIAPVRTGSLQLQPNLVHRCTMGTFSL